jgi:hypothetical protein
VTEWRADDLLSDAEREIRGGGDRGVGQKDHVVTSCDSCPLSSIPSIV